MEIFDYYTGDWTVAALTQVFHQLISMTRLFDTLLKARGTSGIASPAPDKFVVGFGATNNVFPFSYTALAEIFGKYNIELKRSLIDHINSGDWPLSYNHYNNNQYNQYSTKGWQGERARER